MKPWRSVIALLATVFGGGAQAAPSEPSMPYIAQGACPFECCTYREWQAREDVPAYAEPRDDAIKVTTVKIDGRVTAETGFVVTKAAGVVKVLRNISVGYPPEARGPNISSELNLRPGDILYLLHPLGEGNSLFWYEGKTYIDQILFGEPGSREMPEPPFREMSEAKYDWWVKIRTAAGRILWLKNPPYFRYADACAADP